MENIIKKAIDGGYQKERYYFDENGNFDDEPYEVVLMKSSFWKALGKSCGWGNKYVPDFDCIDFEMGQGYVHNALRFHEINLTDGFDKAVEWLEKLIKS